MAAGTRTVGKKKTKIRWKRVLPMYLLALPGIIYMICNNYIPMFGITIAFKKLNVSKGFWGSDWCGLENFFLNPVPPGRSSGIRSFTM